MSEPVTIDPVCPPPPPSPDFFTSLPRWLNYPPAPASAPLSWLWPGYLAARNITLLTSQWKTGKTTLLTLLLSRMNAGGTLAGLPVARGNALVLSEEAAEFWEERDRRLNLSGHVCLLSQPFREPLTHDRWNALLEWIAALHAARGLSLVAIDTVASILPLGVEQAASHALQNLTALRRLTQLGLGILLTNHPRKGVPLPGQASRGTGALPAYVDIQIEMLGLPSAAPDDRRRRLRAFSRHAQTPRDLVLEWTPDGNDYDVKGIQTEDDFITGWPVLRLVFEDAATKLTRQQVLEQWPPDYAKPTPSCVWRWLDAASERGILHRDGAGRRAAPFRYWLPERMQQWLSDPDLLFGNWELYLEMQEAKDRAECAQRAEQERKRREQAARAAASDGQASENPEQDEE